MYLAGFTAEGTRDGRLHVWDLDQGRGWASTPDKTGKRRDYYRLESDADRPARVETGLGLAETEAAPILRRVIDTGTMPSSEDLGVLLVFLALLEARSSGLRESLVQVTEDSTLDRLRKIFEDESRWHELRETIRAEGFDVDSAPGRREMLDAVVNRRIRIESPQDLRVSWVGRMFQVLLPWLRERNWGLLLQPTDRPGEFITSDRPLTIAWTDPSSQNRPAPHFDDRGTDVIIPLSTRHALIGRYESVPSGPTSAVFAAAINSRVVLHAHKYIYSASRDFAILGENDSIDPAPGLLRLRPGQEPPPLHASDRDV